jgi:endoglucanase
MQRGLFGGFVTLAISGTLMSCGSTQKPAAEPAAAADPNAPLMPTKTTAPHHKAGENPFVGAKWWVDPYGQAHLRAVRTKATDPEASALLEKIAQYGGADWVGEWTPFVGNWIYKRVNLLQKNGDLPYFVAYNIPKRDCGQYSAGGASKGDQYKEWITTFARAIGDRRAAVILEPDGLPLLKKCLSDADQKERIELIKFAVHTFESWANTWVYMDAGHPGWIPVPEMAARLKAAGVDEADGFSLNVSNYKATDDVMAYGKQLSAALGGKHFIIDTSRNGNGAPKVDGDSEAAWCNPDGRALGSPPTTDTKEPLCDAFLWIKKPGESDGTCNGGPKAGDFWQDRALDLAKRAKW